MSEHTPSAEEVVIFGESQMRPPDLRLMHYNDVYHVDASSSEPVGGIARFITLCKYYRGDAKFRAQSELVTFFSGIDNYDVNCISGVLTMDSRRCV